MEAAEAKEPAEPETEISAAEYLDNLRAGDSKFIGLSFPTIAAFGEHGAIVHYCADEKSNATICLSAKADAGTGDEVSEGTFLLVDSGAHYLDGTTDVTRTIALGNLCHEMKEHYTLVMMGMLRLMNAKFTSETPASELDKIARNPLTDKGFDFNHSTGHGIGYLNVVHEAPVRISKKSNEFFFKPGMIVSDEPGVYIEGSHGIRIENDLCCMESESENLIQKNLIWKNLTWVPLENAAVCKELMTAEDIKYYNDYQSAVYEKISPHLDEKEREWLKETCSLI